MISDEHVRVERSDHVVTVTLDRPGTRNACTMNMWLAIRDAFREISASDARCVLLTGANGDFCSGADLSPSATNTGWEGNKLLAMRLLGESVMAVHDCPDPGGGQGPDGSRWAPGSASPWRGTCCGARNGPGCRPIFAKLGSEPRLRQLLVPGEAARSASRPRRWRSTAEMLQAATGSSSWAWPTPWCRRTNSTPSSTQVVQRIAGGSADGVVDDQADARERRPRRPCSRRSRPRPSPRT